MSFPIQKALVTGGAGFIGSHLVDALLDRGCEVAVLDDLSTGRMENIAHALDRITFLEGDIRDPDAVDRVMKGCDAVFHQAAVVLVPQTVDDPVGSALVNDIGTLQVLDSARRRQVRRFVFASSCAVYGDDPVVPKVETMALHPKSPYAVQKRTGELYARVFSDLYGLETACLRYFNVFGPRQDPGSAYSGVISIFMTRAAQRTPPVIHGDGNQYRDFIFVKDVVKANLLAATAPDAPGRAFNIGTGQFVTINRLWETISELAGGYLPPEYGDSRAGDIYASSADISLAREVLDFSSDHTFEEGLEQTWQWYNTPPA